MNTTLKGDILEQAVFDYFTKQIADGKFPWKSEFCKVFRKKGYYSKDREGNIKFDVSIEFYMPRAKEYSMVWLIECKNYTGSVPVDNVEEFSNKVQQVAPANSKAIMVSNSAFDPGGMNIARNRKMGIIRFFDSSNVKWVLYRSQSASTPAEKTDESLEVMYGLTTQGYESKAFDLYMHAPDCLTNSLWNFSASMLSDIVLTEDQRDRVCRPNTAPSYLVPYLNQEELESRSLSILRNCGYINGAVSLDDICAYEATRCGLRVTQNVNQKIKGDARPRLGQISFSSLEILIFQQAIPNLGRERFTLAHELAHHFLLHGKYMSDESCDEQDFALLRDSNVIGKEVARMEYQANVFASCLLMPQSSFTGNFRSIVKCLDIPNRGFGELYLDNQPCNYRGYEKVTGELMRFYDVSRAAVSIRLQSLGLLRDVRTETGRYFG